MSKTRVYLGEQVDSIGYYRKNSKYFYDRTFNADVQDLNQKFLKHVPNSGRI